jgi:hypothetical protein
MRAWSCAAVFLATLAVAASAGCKRRRELTYQPISGPGFAVVLPDSRQRGDLLATTTSDNYATGQILYGGSRPFVHAAGVAWRPGTVMTDDELEAALKAMSGLLGAKGERLEVVERPTAVSFGGTPAKRVALAGREQRLVLIETACGARSITVFAMAEDPEPILARADGSYRCLPDPAKDADPGHRQEPGRPRRLRRLAPPRRRRHLHDDRRHHRRLDPVLAQHPGRRHRRPQPVHGRGPAALRRHLARRDDRHRRALRPPPHHRPRLARLLRRPGPDAGHDLDLPRHRRPVRLGRPRRERRHRPDLERSHRRPPAPALPRPRRSPAGRAAPTRRPAPE